MVQVRRLGITRGRTLEGIGRWTSAAQGAVSGFLEVVAAVAIAAASVVFLLAWALSVLH